MTLTRSDAETELVRRAKKRMVMVGMAVTVTGSNDDLSGPMTVALRSMGFTPASPITVTNADLSALADDEVDEFFDRAELRLLENILGSFDQSSIRSGPYSENMSDVMASIEKRIEALRSIYGNAGSSLEAGTISLGFAEKDDDSE